MFSQQKKLGILLGIITGILLATFLNWWLDWNLLALSAGLFVGLETGLWVGVTQLAWNIHKNIFWTTVKTIVAKKVWQIAWTVVQYTLLMLVCFASLAMIATSGIWLSQYTTPLGASFVGLDGLTQTAERFAVNVFATMYMIAMIVLICSLHKYEDFKELMESPKPRWLFITLGIPLGAVVGALSYYFLVIVIGSIAVLIGCLLLWIMYKLLQIISISLLKTAAHHESTTITVGVISGVLSGLGFGLWWTKLAFGPTLLSCLVGCGAGYFLAYITYRVSSSTWFQNTYMLAVTPPDDANHLA